MASPQRDHAVDQIIDVDGGAKFILKRVMDSPRSNDPSIHAKKFCL